MLQSTDFFGELALRILGTKQAGITSGWVLYLLEQCFWVQLF